MANITKMLRQMYDVDVTESNFLDQLLGLVTDYKLSKGYISKYYAENKDVLGYDWGVEMIFFVLSDLNGEWEMMKKSYGRLLKYPPNSDINKRMSYVYGRIQGDFFKAKKLALAAAELNNKDSEVYYELGYIYNLLGLDGKSQVSYKKAAEYATDESLNEVKARSYYNLAVHEIHLDNDKKKVKDFVDKALEAMPSYSEALALSRRLSFAEIGDIGLEEVKDVTEKLLKLVGRQRRGK